MEKRVYWTPEDISDVWHLYPDCTALTETTKIQYGMTEGAINAGKSHVCPICRARFDTDHPILNSPSSQSRSIRVVSPVRRVTEKIAPPPIPATPPDSASPLKDSTPSNGSSPPASSPPQQNDFKYTVIALLVILFFLLIILYPLHQNSVQAAYDNGYDVGHADGVSSGMEIAAQESYDTGYEDGHSQGYEEGYEDGQEEGESNGYGSGYDDGYADGYQDAQQSVSSSGFSYSAPQESTVTVYITATGEKYHRLGCQYLSKSCYSISLSSARSQGYTPCSRCNPPT